MSTRPPDNLGSYQLFYRDGLFNIRKRGLVKVITSLFNRFPNVTYPLGESRYWDSVEKYGHREWTAPHSLWRGFCHFIGGLLIFTVPFAMIEEVRDGYHGSKTVFDVWCWMSGSYVSTSLILIFI